MSPRRKVYLTFPSAQTRESIICDMYDKYNVRFNIRSASVNEQIGLMAVELEHKDHDTITQALKFFESRGLTVEPIEMDVITG